MNVVSQIKHKIIIIFKKLLNLEKSTDFSRLVVLTIVSIFSQANFSVVQNAQPNFGISSKS